MKKITLLFTAAIMALSCSDDDTKNVSLDGTWKLTYVNTNSEAIDLNGDGVASDNYMDESNCLENSTITFGEENTALFSPNCRSHKPGPESVTYTVSNDHVEFSYHTIAYPDSSRKASYKRSGNKLIATFDYSNYEQYIPGQGEYYDVNPAFLGSTFIYIKQ